MGFKRKRNQDFGQDAVVGGVLPYFGSNDKDQQNDYLSDIDISQPYSTTSSTGAPITLYSPADPTNQPKIRTPTRFRSGILKFRSPEDDQEITIITESMSGSYNLALPAIGGNDRILTRDTISSIANIAKSALPTAIAYEDEANTFAVPQKLEAYSELKAVAVPGNPAAGYVRLFIDSGDSKIKIKRSDGTVIDLEAFGPGGGLDERVIMKVGNVAVSATARRLNLVDGSLFEAPEDIANDQFNLDIKDGGITDAHLAGSISYSKLSIAGSIVNSDIHVAAAIAYGKLNLTGAILDADLAGSITNAKLLQITDKAKLHTAILYSDVDNSLGSHFVDIAEIAEPTTPGATVGRMFFDTADKHLKLKKGTGTVVDLESGGGGGAGGGMAAGGIVTKSGDANEVQFLIPHGMSPTPEIFWVEPASSDAFGHYERDIDATNITIRYAAPPPSGTNNLVYNWAVGYINAAGGGFTPTSTTEMSNKIIANYLDFKEIAVPTSPVADVGRVFLDAADEHIKVVKSGGTVVDLEAAGTGGGGGGGGMAAGGVIQRSGNATTTVFTIPHGLSPQPDLYWAEPASDDAMGNRRVTIDATNITITYGVSPPTAFNNLTYHWAAGYVNAASGGFTPTSTTTITNKTINAESNTIKIPSPFKYFIYLDPVDNKFKARNGKTGVIDYISTDNTDAQPVIQSAINANSNSAGVILLADNTLFPLVTVSTNRHITMRTGTVLRGGGYSTHLRGTVGMIIVYMNTVDNCVVENLRVDAQNTNGETGMVSTFGTIMTTAASPNFCNNIWINRVWSYNAVGSHIKLKRCKVGYVTNCYTEVSGLDVGAGPGGILASDGGESVNFIGNICKNTGAEALGVYAPAEDHYRVNILGNISFITADSPISDTGRIGTAEKGRGHILIEGEGPPGDNYGTFINIANNILHTTYYGISLQSGKFVHIHDNTIYNTGFTAQALAGINISGAGGNDIDVHDNMIYDVAEQGIRVAAESTRLKIHNNQIINCGSKTANTFDGIYHNTSSGFASNTIDIYDNTMTDTRGASKMMRDGLRMETSGTGTTTNTFLRNNFSSGHTGLAENIVSAVVTFRERMGTATAVTDGSTITHKLSATPTWAAATGTVTGEIVTIPTVSATTLTVAIKKWTGGTLTAGTSQTVYWRALV